MIIALLPWQQKKLLMERDLKYSVYIPLQTANFSNRL